MNKDEMNEANEGKEKLKHVLTEEEYSEITAGTEFKISWYFWKKK